MDDFFKVRAQFQLGALVTESQNPRTRDLSLLSKTDLGEAIRILKSVDLDAIRVLLKQEKKLGALALVIKETLQSGGRVFLCGCGATGRLALNLENLFGDSKRVIAFMAGGDFALVKSVENFEDHPEYGARHLRELGFSTSDLLVSCTEGGETPYVIGATEEAVRLSRRAPYFLYCNPDPVLVGKIKRSRDVIRNSKIKKINLTCGPMSLTGSTRLQASTVLQLAVGLALFPSKKSIGARVQGILKDLSKLDFHFLEKFIVKESAIYKKGESVLYETKNAGMTVLTDTTERSPTFSMRPFENLRDPKPLALSKNYLVMTGARDSKQAWKKLLGREPRGLKWEGFKLDNKVIYGFDFSTRTRKRRKDARLFQINFTKRGIAFYFEELKCEMKVSNQEVLLRPILLKILLNTHSTLVMGRYGRYQSNLMTWVRPSNFKLIDRATRYVGYLLAQKKIRVPYLKIAKKLTAAMGRIPQDQSVVLYLFNEFYVKSKGA